jgi:hypothetical protein
VGSALRSVSRPAYFWFFTFSAPLRHLTKTESTPDCFIRPVFQEFNPFPTSRFPRHIKRLPQVILNQTHHPRWPSTLQGPRRHCHYLRLLALITVRCPFIHSLLDCLDILRPEAASNKDPARGWIELLDQCRECVFGVGVQDCSVSEGWGEGLVYRECDVAMFAKAMRRMVTVDVALRRSVLERGWTQG